MADDPSLHDTISEAFDKVSGGDGASTPGASPTPPASQEPPPTGAPQPEPSAPAPSRESPAGYLAGKTPAPTPVDRGDGRDPTGRFAPRTPGQEAPAAGDTTQPAPDAPPAPGAPKAPPEPAQPALKPPSSWRPAIREHWAKLPPEVQAEVSRREQDMIRQQGEVRPMMNFAQGMARAMQPYSADIQAVAGGDLVQFNAANAQARHVIFHGEPQQRADFLADLIVNAGVNPELLDGALARRMEGRGPAFVPQPPPQPQPTIREQVIGVLREEMNQRLGMEASTEIDRLATDPKFEFLEELREEMADIMELAARRQLNLTLQQAYDRAASMHPEIGPIVARRADEARAKQAADAAAAARRAGVSLPSGGAPQGSPDGKFAGDNLRDTVAAAYDAASRAAAGR